MQRVVIIPENEFEQLVARLGNLEKKVQRLEQGLTIWIRGTDAINLGFSRTTLYEMRADGRLELGVDYKYEGRSVYYNRTRLQALNEEQRPAYRRYSE